MVRAHQFNNLATSLPLENFGAVILMDNKMQRVKTQLSMDNKTKRVKTLLSMDNKMKRVKTQLNMDNKTKRTERISV